METWANLKPDTPFNKLFPDSKVPIKSIFPIIPREEGSPHCYVVDAKYLSQEQIQALAEELYQMWQPECTSVQMAIDYINQGLPLNIEHFNGVTSTSPSLLSMLLGEPEQSDEFDDFSDDDEFEDDDDLY